MANIENLIAKIKKDGEDQAKAVTDQAQVDVKALIESAKSSAEEQGKAIAESAAREAQSAGEVVLTNLRFEARNELIKARQESIDKVFATVLERLRSMDRNAFEAFVKSTVASSDPDGEEIILPAGYQYKNIDWLNSYLKQKGQKGNLTLHTGERTIQSGFILVKGGIEKNNTFETLLDFHRYELENEVNEVLFGKGGSSA